MSGSSPLVGSSRINKSASGRGRRDQSEFLTIALGVVADPLGRVELEPLDEPFAVRGLHATVRLSEQRQCLMTGEARARSASPGTYAMRRWTCGAWRWTSRPNIVALPEVVR